MTNLKTIALAVVAAISLSASTAAKADFWVGGPGVGVGAGPYYDGYAWGGGPYYVAGWNSGYSVGWGNWRGPAWAYAYSPRVRSHWHAYRPASYRAYAYAPGYHCRTVVVHRHGWEKRARRCY